MLRTHTLVSPHIRLPTRSLGIAADVAGEGEVWLSSQNRNFKNRCVRGMRKCVGSAHSMREWVC